jgi:hypothetical protein
MLAGAGVFLAEVRSVLRDRCQSRLQLSAPLRLEPLFLWRSNPAKSMLTAKGHPIVGHWDPIEEWRSSGGEHGHKLVDITHWMAIPSPPGSTG